MTGGGIVPPPGRRVGAAHRGRRCPLSLKPLAAPFRPGTMVGRTRRESCFSKRKPRNLRGLAEVHDRSPVAVDSTGTSPRSVPSGSAPARAVGFGRHPRYIRAVNDRVACRVGPGGTGLAPLTPRFPRGRWRDFPSPPGARTPRKGPNHPVPPGVSSRANRSRKPPSPTILPVAVLNGWSYFEKSAEEFSPGTTWTWGVFLRDFEIGAFKVLQTWTILLVERLRGKNSGDRGPCKR